MVHTAFSKAPRHRVAFLLEKFEVFYTSKTLLFFIVFYGLTLRIAQFLANRSLWLDEAKLSHHLLSRSFLELTGPLKEPILGKPIGFLWAERFFINLFGESEYALRLFPLLCGCAALFLFYKIALEILSKWTLPVALALFALSDRLIYYSSELNHYSSDVFVALVCYAMIFRMIKSRLGPKEMFGWGIFGALLLWISFPAAFILGGCGIALLLFSCVERNGSRFVRLCLITALWGLSLIAHYFVTLSRLTKETLFTDYFRSGYLPFPPVNFSELKLLGIHFQAFMEYTMALNQSTLALWLFFSGVFFLLMNRKEKELLLLLSPFLTVLTASRFGLYSFYDRLTTFLVPGGTLLVACGLEWFFHSVPRFRFRYAAAAVLALLMVLDPLKTASMSLIKPRTVEEIRPVLRFVRENWQEGDGIYLYSGAKRAFQYYQGRFRFGANDYVLGKKTKNKDGVFDPDVSAVIQNYPRVWFVFSHVQKNPRNEEEWMTDYLNQHGQPLRIYRADGAAAYLYDRTPFKSSYRTEAPSR